jgi:hypothetical protein
LGYRSFKYVDQGRLARGDMNGQLLNSEGDPCIYKHDGGSGPFGEETMGTWLSLEQATVYAQRYVRIHNLIGNGGRYSHRLPARIAARLLRAARRMPSHSWYDLHAKM